MLYTDWDLNRSFSYITTMNDKGEIVSQKKLPSNGEVAEFLKGFASIVISGTPTNRSPARGR